MLDGTQGMQKPADKGPDQEPISRNAPSPMREVAAPAAKRPARFADLAGTQPGRWVLAALVFGLMGFTAWWWARGIEIKTHALQRGSAAEVVYATGVVEPTNWAKVVSLQRKRIVEICRCEGKTVVKGEVLARLDDQEERAGLAELEARLRRLKEDSERLRMLLERSATTRTAYDDKVTQIREYEARVAAQKDRIADLELRAPMDGVVLRRDGEVGEIAGTGTNDVLLWIGQAKPLRVVSEVSEDDVGRVREGQKVLLRHEGFTGRTLTATVGSITPKGDPQTKTFRVYLTLPDDTPLQIGMSVEANIVVREATGAVLVPAEALSDSTAQVVENGRLRRTQIETGLRGTRLVEVRGGLSEGAVVASPFRNDLKDGTRVRAAPKATP